MGQELGRRPSCGRVAQRMGSRVRRRAVRGISSPGKKIIIIAIVTFVKDVVCQVLYQALYWLYLMIFTIAPGCRVSPCAHFTEN